MSKVATTFTPETLPAGIGMAQALESMNQMQPQAAPPQFAGPMMAAAQGTAMRNMPSNVVNPMLRPRRPAPGAVPPPPPPPGSLRGGIDMIRGSVAGPAPPLGPGNIG
jgi:hypothetical protein